MIGEWCFMNTRFEPEFCQKIIDIALTIPAQKAAIGVNNINAQVDSTYRRSTIRFIEKRDARFKFLFDRLWKNAIEANDVWFKFDITKLDYIQFAEYDYAEQAEYKRHCDVFWINGDPTYHRKLSCTVQLTNPSNYEGGELELFDVSQTPDPNELKKQGTVLFFPSFIPHAVAPITKGTRYSLAVWFDGPKWR